MASKKLYAPNWTVQDFFDLVDEAAAAAGNPPWDKGKCKPGMRVIFPQGRKAAESMRKYDPELLDIFKTYSLLDKRIYVVTQFNHPKEITMHSIGAVNNLLRSGVLVNNQAVLLKNVNDDPLVLSTLLKDLVRIGVAPYYVFQCRPVKRVKYQFQVPICKGLQIIEEAKANCDGLSKRFKYIMSHKTGKIEIIGVMNGNIYFKYHQAKDKKNYGKVFSRKINETAGWLEDFQ